MASTSTLAGGLDQYIPSIDARVTMASMDTLQGITLVYNGIYGWSRDARLAMPSKDTLAKGLDQYILASMDGSRMPE